MGTSSDLAGVLDLVSKILLWCFVLGFAVLLFWFVCILAAGEFIYGVHATMFDVSKHEFDVLNYYGMAVLKLFISVFYLIPYLAIRLVAYRMPRRGESGRSG
jgi:hypothetical protein